MAASSSDTDASRPLAAIFVATSGHSGVDRVVANLAPAMARHGIRVDILRIRGHGPHIDAGADGLVRVVELDASHAYTALAALVRYLRQARPDALLTDKDRVNRVAIIAHWIARSPAHLTVRTGTTVSLNLAARKWLDRRINLWSMRHLYRRADAIILPSAGAADDFAQTTGMPRGRITVCPSPVATPELDAASQRKMDPRLVPPGDGPLLVGIGELSLRKDYATALRAFAALDPARGARLAILGEGRERATLIALADQLGVTERVTFPGFVPNPYPVLARADVFVHSARLEGSPIVVMEAIALGRPVVSTDCPSGPREVLEEGRIGRLVPVGAADAMGEAIGEMLDAPPLPEIIRESARRFSPEVSARAYCAALGLSCA